MNKYMLILFEDAKGYEGMSAEDYQKEIEMHMKWMEELGAHFDTGNALEGEAKTIKGASKIVSDGPYIEAKEMVGGFYMINANSLDEATELAKGCPVPQLGGSIEVRPVMDIE